MFNFLGVLVMTHFNSSVASTISNMVDFGGNTHEALIALCAALFSIVVYSVAASMVRHPHQREPQPDRRPFRRGHRHPERPGRHQHAPSGSRSSTAWWSSLALGFCMGWVVCKGLTMLCRKMDRRQHQPVLYRRAQIFGAAAMSFMHGAQDGQKFIGVLFLGVAFSNGMSSVSGVLIPVWLMVLCSAGDGHWHQRGRREDHQGRGHGHGEAGKIPGLLRGPLRRRCCLLLSSLFGIPVSTTHTKTSAIMGVGAVEAAFRHQLWRGEGHGAHLGVHLPRLRPNQLCYGKTIYAAVLRGSHSPEAIPVKEQDYGQETRQFLL